MSTTTKAWICHKCRRMCGAFTVICTCGTHRPVQVAVTDSTVGPKHDPYSRTTYTATITAPDGSVPWHLRLVCCSLSGVSLEINGAMQSNIYRGERDPERTIAEFERLVGRTLDEIAHMDDPFGHPSQHI